MSSIYHDRLRDGQIVWVEHTEQLYVTRKFVHSLQDTVVQMTQHHSILPT